MKTNYTNEELNMVLVWLVITAVLYMFAFTAILVLQDPVSGFGFTGFTILAFRRFYHYSALTGMFGASLPSTSLKETS